MAHQIIITISDEAYAAMTAAAAEKGQPIEKMAAETFSNRFAISPTPTVAKTVRISARVAL